MDNNLVVGRPDGNQSQNARPIAVCGPAGDQYVSEIHGKWYAQARAGNLFIGSTAAAGVLIPIFSGTAVTFGLWNPAGSGKNAELVRYAQGAVSTTGAPGSVLLMYTTGLGAAIATGGPITAFNAAAPVNGLIGGGAASAMKFTPAGTTTLTTAPSVHSSLGLNQMTTTFATTSSPVYQTTYDFDGQVIVPPGVGVWIMGTAALLTLFAQSLSWVEVPA